MNDLSEVPSNLNSLDVFPLFKIANQFSDEESKAIVDKPKKVKQSRNTNPSESNPFQCTICNIAVSSQIVYEEHVKGRRHQMQLQQILLKNPDYKTPTFNELIPINQPKKTVHDQKQTVISSTDFVCNICRVKCNSKKKFDLHIAGKKHQMNLRDQAFSKIVRSSQSMSSCICNVCSRRYHTPKELQKHRLSNHSMRKNLEADRCDEAERQNQINFDDYRIPSMDRTPNRFQYECRICQRKFREKIHVLGHIASAYHIEQIARIRKDSLRENDQIMIDTANSPFFTSEKSSYSSMSNPTRGSYDQIQDKYSRAIYNPEYSNSYEQPSTNYSWNHTQYYPTQSDSYYNSTSCQYQSTSYYNQTSNYDVPRSSYLTYPY